MALALGAVGALGLALAGPPAGSAAVGALGWAGAAGVFLMLMLRGRGIQAMGVLLTLLAAGAGVAAVFSGGWALALLLPAVLLLVGGIGALLSGMGWRKSAGAGPRSDELDAWKQFDQGDDPTDVVGDSDSR